MYLPTVEPQPYSCGSGRFSTKDTLLLASFPGSPRARTKNRKERGEPGKIYHVRNVIGRENLITCGRTNELAHAAWTEHSCDSFMADRMGLDGTMLHYLAVRKAMVSVHRPIRSKITLTYSLTWQTDSLAKPDPSNAWVWLRQTSKLTALHPGEWLSRRY